MRVTIFGATGLLGNALMQEWTGDEVTGLGIEHVDVRNEQQIVDAVERTRPEWIVLAAAYADVDGCESNQKLAFDVNCHGAVTVAKAAKQFGAKLLFVSTDYVFDGTKTTPYETDDPRAPQSVYGHTKADAEVEISKILPECCIMRTSWLFGVGGKSFPDTILKLAASRPTLDVVDNQRGCPTYTRDLVRAMKQLCHKDARGIVHVTNSGECSWYEFAREIVAGAHLSAEIRPTTTDKFPRPAPRPKYSVLSAKSRERYGIPMPTWQDALQRYLAERG